VLLFSWSSDTDSEFFQAWTFISGQCKLFGGTNAKREAEPQQQGGAGGAQGGQGTHDSP
jgi:hypothetical protein